MKATTPKFKQIMASGNARDYVIKVDLTLADDPTTPTVLNLDESDIWNDSFSIETASSGTSSFDIGTAVIGQCKFSLNNFDERFNQYDFFNASAVVWVGLKGDTDNNDHQVYYRLGFYTVDEPTFAGALIQLILLDNMWKFDVPMITLNYPISCLNAVLAICSHCDVQLDQTVQFHGASFTISEAPVGIENMNCRDFIQYVAMIGCNFCIITPEGKLKLRWYEGTPGIIEDNLDGGTYNTSTTPYSDGDSADGGNFSDYTSGDSYDGGEFTDGANADYFTRNLNLTMGTDEIKITGVKFIIDETAHTIGSSGYMLELENPLVNVNNVNSVLNLIWDVLENFTLRIFNLTTTSDLAVEVGDCCVIKDYKGNSINSWVTMNVFKFANHNVQCNAIAPTRTLTKQFSKVVQAAVEEARQAAGQVISNYDLAVQMMNSLAVNAMGGYEDFEDAPTGGRIWYLSNMPITKTGGVCSFETGSTVYKKSGDGFFVSRDGGITWVNGYNMSTGELVVNVLDAIGINFDWARGGTLTLGGYGNGNGVLSIQDANNVEKVHGDNTGLKVGGTTGSQIRITTDGNEDYYYDNAYAGRMHMDAVNYGTQADPDLRDTFLIEDFNDIGLRSDDEMSEIYLSTQKDESTNYDNGYVRLYGHKQTGASSYQYSELQVDGDGIKLNGAIYASGNKGYSGEHGYPTFIDNTFYTHDLEFTDGIVTGYDNGYTPYEVPNSQWHSWQSGVTTYVAIILGVGVTQAVFPDLDSDDSISYEPHIKCASGVSAPKITDMVRTGNSITVTFTAVTQAQAGSGSTSECVIKLLRIKG